jgi:hypothetical protein
MAAFFLTAPILIAVTLQLLGHCDHCIQSLINDPFGRGGRFLAASYFTLAFSCLVAAGLSMLKHKMSRRYAESYYLKDSDT